MADTERVSSEFVDSQVAIFYASQTGNAESISHSLYSTAVQRGFSATWHVLDDHGKAAFNDVRTAVFVVSTTGDGDPPDNSARFWRVLRKATRDKATAYAHLRFAILGLGDSNYSNFCNTAQRLERQLVEAGATAFYGTGLADDGTGLEDVVEPWIEGLWPALARVAQCSSIKLAEAEDISKGGDTVISAKGIAGQGSSISAVDMVVASVSSLSLTHNPSVPQPIHVDFTPLASLKAITGAARLAPAVCAIVQVETGSSAELAAPDDADYPPWHAALAGGMAEDAFLVPFLATVVSCTQLTTTAALKRTVLMELDVSGRDAEHARENWQAGDAFNVYAPNDARAVAAVLARLGVGVADAHRPVLLAARDAGGALPAHLQCFAGTAASVYSMLRWAADLGAAPRKQELRALADYCGEAVDRDRLLFLSSRQGAAAFDALRRLVPSIVDILHAFPSCRPPVERLLDLLPPLVPRAYSLCCAPHGDSARWRFAFNVVEYRVDPATADPAPADPAAIVRSGLCTPWLEALACASPPRRILVARRRSTVFRLPPQPDARPVIMVGPGTGVAPFVGFLEQRAHELRASGAVPPPTWLFFGCRSQASDFLFRTQLEQWRDSGVLGRLTLSFSRDAGSDTKYVQHAMALHEDELAELLLTKDALLFVCGDAKGMGRDVNDALAGILCRYTHARPELTAALLAAPEPAAPSRALSKPEALQLLARWTADHRYLRDLWA